MRFPSRLPLALPFSLFLSTSHLPLAKPQSDLPPDPQVGSYDIRIL